MSQAVFMHLTCDNPQCSTLRTTFMFRSKEHYEKRRTGATDPLWTEPIRLEKGDERELAPGYESTFKAEGRYVCGCGHGTFRG